MSSYDRCLFVLTLTGFLNGCAVHYYNPDTGIEHLYGFGHVALKVQAQPDEPLAYSRQFDTVGLGVARLKNESWILLGAGRHTDMELLQKDTCFLLEWQDTSLMHVRVGSSHPEYLGQPGINCKEAEKK